MSESTTPSDKKVPGAQPPWAPGNRAKCNRCDKLTNYPVYITDCPDCFPDTLVCAYCAHLHSLGL